MYSGVPTTMPLWVRPLASDSPSTLAMPKSRTLTCSGVLPRLTRTTLPGFMSRWITPWSWAACSAWQICSAIERTRFHGSEPDSPSTCERSLPCRYSITKKGWLSGVTPKSVISTTFG